MDSLGAVLFALISNQSALGWLLIATLFVSTNVLLIVIYLYAVQLSIRAKLAKQGISCMPFSVLGVAAAFSAHTNLATEKFEDEKRASQVLSLRCIFRTQCLYRHWPSFILGHN